MWNTNIKPKVIYLTSYGKCFSIILLFFSYSLGENKLDKILSFVIILIKPIKNCPQVIESYASIL